MEKMVIVLLLMKIGTAAAAGKLARAPIKKTIWK